MTSTPSEPLLTLAVITGPHGIRGQVKAKPFTAFPDDILAYGPLSSKDGSRQFECTITGDAKGQLILSIKGSDSRNDADALKGTELCVPRSALPEAEDDEFYINDLVGLTVQLSDGTAHGTIKAMHNFGAGDIVEITRASDGKSEMQPFLNSAFPEIDMEKRTLTFLPPETIDARENKG